MGIILRIFLSCLLTFVRLLWRLFKWLVTGATPNGNRANISVQVNHGVVEDFGDTAETDSQAYEYHAVEIEKRTSVRAASPNSPHIIESVQNTYLPSTLRVTNRVTGALQAFAVPNPSPSDFWEKAKEYEKLLQDYVPRLLRGAAAHFKSTKFTDIASHMHHIVNATATFRDNIKGPLDAHNITFDKLTEELEGIFMGIVNGLKKIPPPDKAPGHTERLEMVDKVLGDTALALISLATRYGIKEEIVTTYLFALRPHVQALTVAVGDINEQHPKLFPTVAFSVASLLIPESWILRSFLSVFGFGPAGPIKGSAAAWMQRRFWGASVKSGSWFSLLQQAGMGVYPKWMWLASEVPLLVGNLLALLPPLRRE